MLSLHRLAKTEQNSFVEMDSQWSTLMGVDSSTCLIISYSPDAPAHEAYHFHEEGGIPVVAAFHFLLWKEKVYITPHLWRLDYIAPNLWNYLYHPLNFAKRVKLPPTAVSKNHSKSHKIHKMENQIVLDFKWVDLPNEHIKWNALVQFFVYSFRSMFFFVVV
jgi:hypothetical protein